MKVQDLPGDDAQFKMEFDDQVIEDCFKILTIESKPGKEREIFVPVCAQFKAKNLTEVNFDNLTATINGVLCISFLIFTKDEQLQKYLVRRLHWNEIELYKINVQHDSRRKKIERENHMNYVPILFNKDTNVKLPTTRVQQYQISSYTEEIKYNKSKKGNGMTGIRVVHVIRKEFVVEIQKSSATEEFFAPFSLINLKLTIQIDPMQTSIQYQQQMIESLEQIMQHIDKNQKDQQRKAKLIQNFEKLGEQLKTTKQRKDFKNYKKISFNILRIEQASMNERLSVKQRMLMMSPMISYSNQQSFGKYSIVKSKLQGYSHDKQVISDKRQAFEDNSPTALNFKPFKYATYIIPLSRLFIIDIMTIFLPIYILALVNIFLYFQNTQIMNRIVNVASIMIAYAAIQPIVRNNVPYATSLTLVDVFIYLQLLNSAIYLVQSFFLLPYYDSLSNPPLPAEQAMYNNDYQRTSDAGFWLSVAISSVSAIIIVTIIVWYKCQNKNYEAEQIPRAKFSISRDQNWSLSLMTSRSFARYKQKLRFLF